MKATATPVASHTTRPTTKSSSAPTTAKLSRRRAQRTAVVALTTRLSALTTMILVLEAQQFVLTSSLTLLMSICGTVLSRWDVALGEQLGRLPTKRPAF